MDKLHYFLYKTSVSDQHAVEQLSCALNDLIGSGHWNFDLKDADKVLRIKSDHNIRLAVESLLGKLGYTCTELHYLPEEVTPMQINASGYIIL